MANRKEFQGLDYRQLQRVNSTQKQQLREEELMILKNEGHKNIGWESVIRLQKRIQELLTSVYRKGWGLDQLFLEADRIGRKYQSSTEIAVYEEQLTILSMEIDDVIDEQFPDTEVEIISFSGKSNEFRN
ncbi:MAG: hypothetical protein ACEQSC_00580, partial [Candidatus Nanopelagicaceae bacterium]